MFSRIISAVVAIVIAFGMVNSAFAQDTNIITIARVNDYSQDINTGQTTSFIKFSYNGSVQYAIAYCVAEFPTIGDYTADNIILNANNQVMSFTTNECTYDTGLATNNARLWGITADQNVDTYTDDMIALSTSDDITFFEDDSFTIYTTLTIVYGIMSYESMVEYRPSETITLYMPMVQN